MSVSTGNALGVSAMIPEIDFLVVELSEIEIVLESLEDCMCFSDTVESLFSLISSVELLFKPDFKGKSVLLVAFLKELTGFSQIQTYLKCWKNLFEIELLLP